ncbi:hypothetical protein [Cyanobium sp. ATX 6F1]|uniref:hypothetical protein n=1 Tax=unclassified Cyanobium TaxID=2627006 RepID=UPI0020CFD317|nr:hypothetical protein [Cyanobium sp. ATX 6F1]MCP9917411.1 hypothetical protein [Cyanobium sp. ATX 6F1]
MVKRLEQVAAVVIAAGLAIVSYWLFFSWAKRDDSKPRGMPVPAPSLSQPSPQRPALPESAPAPTSAPQP